MRTLSVGALLLGLAAAAPAAADDAAGCKDHPLFNRMPNFTIQSCEGSEFALKRFPVGPVKPESAEDRDQPLVDVEGPFTLLTYALKEGAPPPSDLQIMRNFEAAVKRAGGSVEGLYPGWCKAMFDYETFGVIIGRCMNFSLTGKLVKSGREHWVFVQPLMDEGVYHLVVSEREAMKQDIAANELLDKINQDGFIALYINFDTGKASIKPDSAKTLDEVAAALKSAPDLKLEVAGHTDNVGAAEANLKLSEERAKAVVAALSQRGIDAKRLTPKGYGQTAPAADNRSEEGRAKNRRVELVKK